MARRVFDTYHASNDEIDGVKNALEENGIEYFETQKGRWWVGSAALWVKHDENFEKAREVIDEFQLSWKQSVRQQSSPEGIRWARLPVAIVVIGLILYLMTFWYWL